MKKTIYRALLSAFLCVMPYMQAASWQDYGTQALDWAWRNPVKTAVGAVATCSAVGGYASKYFSLDSRIKRAIDAEDEVTLRQLLVPIAEKAHIQRLRDQGAMDIGMLEDRDRSEGLILYNSENYAHDRKNEKMRQLILDILAEQNLVIPPSTLLDALPFGIGGRSRQPMDLLIPQEYDLLKAINGFFKKQLLESVLASIKTRLGLQRSDVLLQRAYNRAFMHMLKRAFDKLTNGPKGNYAGLRPDFIQIVNAQQLPLAIDTTDIPGIAQAIASMAPKSEHAGSYEEPYTQRYKNDFGVMVQRIEQQLGSQKLYDELQDALASLGVNVQQEF